MIKKLASSYSLKYKIYSGKREEVDHFLDDSLFDLLFADGKSKRSNLFNNVQLWLYQPQSQQLAIKAHYE